MTRPLAKLWCLLFGHDWPLSTSFEAAGQTTCRRCGAIWGP